MLLSNAFLFRNLSSLHILSRKYVYLEECSFPGPCIGFMNSIRALLNIKTYLRVAISSAISCAKGWWCSSSLNIFCLLHNIAVPFEGLGLQFFNFILFSLQNQVTLLPSMSKVTKRKAPVDLDFTLRRVFGKTGFRYCLCDRLFLQDADGQ